jgi:hypothetical protein
MGAPIGPPAPTTTTPSTPVVPPAAPTTPLDITVPIKFGDQILAASPLLEPISRDEFARIIEGRLDEPRNDSFFGKWVMGGVVKKGGTDVGPVANKIAEMIPAELLRKENADEMWLMPFVGLLARGAGRPMKVNGVEVAPEVTTMASEIFTAKRDAQLEDLLDESTFKYGQLAEQGINPPGPQDIAAGIYATLLSQQDIEIVLSPTVDEATSAVVQASNTAGATDDKGNPADPAPTKDPVSATQDSWDQLASAISVADDQTTVTRQMPPVLTQADLQTMVGSGLMDFEGLVSAQSPQFTNDSQTGALIRIRPDAAAGTGAVIDPRSTVRPAEPGPVTQRVYSALSAVGALEAMKPNEIVNVQDKLARAGYIADDSAIIRGVADEPTRAAWRSLYMDAVRDGRAALDILSDRVRTSISRDTAQTYGDDWGQKNLGRNLTSGEAYAFSKYMNDPTRPAPTGNLNVGDQVHSYFTQQFESERTARVARTQGQSLRGWTQAWARDHNVKIPDVAEATTYTPKGGTNG